MRYHFNSHFNALLPTITNERCQRLPTIAQTLFAAIAIFFLFFKCYAKVALGTHFSSLGILVGLQKICKEVYRLTILHNNSMN